MSRWVEIAARREEVISRQVGAKLNADTNPKGAGRKPGVVEQAARDPGGPGADDPPLGQEWPCPGPAFRFRRKLELWARSNTYKERINILVYTQAATLAQ
jgi:hypothetical protein